MPTRVRTLTLVLALAFGCAGPATDTTTPPKSRGLAGHLDSSLGVSGATCQTACDCQDGLGCTAGRCSASATMTHCCSAAACPSGQACQSSSGAISACGGASSSPSPPTPTPDLSPPFPTGTPDGGGGGLCSLVLCFTNTDCTSSGFGCTTCDPTTLVCH